MMSIFTLHLEGSILVRLCAKCLTCYLCVCVHVPVGTCMCESTGGGQRSASGVILQGFSTLFFETESLTGLELASKQLGIHLSPPLSTGISRAHHHAKLFHMGSGVSKLARQALPSYLPQAYASTSIISTVPWEVNPLYR